MTVEASKIRFASFCDAGAKNQASAVIGGSRLFRMMSGEMYRRMILRLAPMSFLIITSLHLPVRTGSKTQKRETCVNE